jgi:hypothetical protein
MLMKDIEIIAATFPGLGISEGFGTLYVITPVFFIDCGWLDVILLSHHFLHVKRFLERLHMV